MKLKLLHIDNFINRNKLKEVTSINLFSNIKNQILDINGLWSEEIFGLRGSKERSTRFAYVNLKTKVIHPEVYNILININSDLKKLILQSEKYIINKDGQLIIDSNGSNGITFFIQNFDKINLKAISKPEKKQEVEFILNNIERIFIDKYIILPAGIRDLIAGSVFTKVMYSEINDKYKQLIQNCLLIQQDTDNELQSLITQTIQKSLLDINSWIKNQFKGKQGLFRGLLLKKVNDFSARVVITVDPKIKLGSIGIPWDLVFICYEPFCFNRILKDTVLKNEISKFIKLEDPKQLDLDKLKEFSLIINKNSETIPPDLKSLIIEMLSDLIKDFQILYKRDPVTTRYNWRAGHIIITDTNSAVLNPLDLGPLAGDIDGDQIALFTLFTKQSNDEAKMLNPIYNKSIFHNTKSYNDLTFNLSKDAIATLYALTIE